MNNKQNIRAMRVPFGIFLSLVLFTLFVAKADALSVITTSLDMGSRSADVTTLQTFLSQDTNIYPQQLVTGYYGALTVAAVKNFQVRYGISAIGRVGPQTRAQINLLIANGGFGSGSTITAGQAPFIFGVTSGLTSQNGGTATSSVTLTWQTDKNARGKVYYSSTPFFVGETSSPTMEPTVAGAVVITDDSYTVSKSVTLNNLWPNNTGTTYYYMVEAIDATGNVSATWPRTFNSAGASSQY